MFPCCCSRSISQKQTACPWAGAVITLVPCASMTKLRPRKSTSSFGSFSRPTRLHSTNGVRLSTALIRAMWHVVSPPKFPKAHNKDAPSFTCSCVTSGNHRSKQICTLSFMPSISQRPLAFPSAKIAFQIPVNYASFFRYLTFQNSFSIMVTE